MPRIRDLCTCDKFDLVNMIHAIDDHSFMLRLALSHLGEGAQWTEDIGKEINQGLILIHLYLDHLQDIINKGVY